MYEHETVGKLQDAMGLKVRGIAKRAKLKIRPEWFEKVPFTGY